MKKSQQSENDATNRVLDFVHSNPNCSSSEILKGLGAAVSLATVKRILQQLLSENQVDKTGKGKSTRYNISDQFGLMRSTDVDRYFQKEIDERKIFDRFNFLLIKTTLANVALFSDAEKKHLSNLQMQFRNNVSRLSESEYKKEMERLAIDLSWKSSQIEGNTYSLLETEQLLKEKITAAGKTSDEAVMLLNHKVALDFILSHPDYVNPLTVSIIENIHSILIKDLNIDRNIRTRSVGVSGTNYKPLDNEFQIREALTDMCELVNECKDVFSKALLILVLISYIQPFADGNKRTARIISNAILLHENNCPLSFRTVDPIDYKKAMLIFYEQNNISAFKKIFIEQYEFAVRTYF